MGDYYRRSKKKYVKAANEQRRTIEKGNRIAQLATLIEITLG